ncbi:MAG: AraC family transcriptional regulator, partial [Boseongicola sp.]|nr:AraC family transcriptional regulator [Boseongicola sp.]
MSMQRLTLLPLAEAKASTQRLHLSARVKPIPKPVQTAEVTSISRMSQGGRWRTEAMRSYDRPVLIWFTRGQGRLTISGRSGGYSAHSAVFLPAGTMHGFTATPAVLGSVVRLTEGDWPQEPVHLRLREVRLHRELTGMIDAIENEQNNEAPGQARAIAHHEGLLSIWFERTCKTMPTAEQADAPNAAALRLTEAFTALVERDFNRPLGVQHYAAQLGVTPT